MGDTLQTGFGEQHSSKKPTI